MKTAESKTNGQQLVLPGTETPHEELKSWALVELFGHQRIVGFLSTQNLGTGVLFRVDVPDLLKDGKLVRPGHTRYFGIGAIYSISPVSEKVVRDLLPQIDGLPEARPIQRLRSYDEDYG